MKPELLGALRPVARDRSIRAVVLTGAGRAFCAGQDLKERLEPDRPRSRSSCASATTRSSARCAALDQPIIGAINGVAAGAGASLAFACDLRIAAEGASFVLAFGRIGLVPDSGATWFLPRLVGPAKAAELALLGDPLQRFGRRTVRPRGAGASPADALAAEARAIALRLAGAGAAGPRPDQTGPASELVARPRGRPWRTRRTGRVSPAPGRSRRGSGRLPREAAASVHRGVAPVALDAAACHGRRLRPNKR